MAKTKYKKEWCEKVVEWGREGLIDLEISKRLGISLASLYNYKRDYPEFAQALDQSKAEADYVVKESLFKRATGYFYDEVEETADDTGYVVKTKKTRKHVLPDVKAQIAWLQNREPDEWREKKEIKHEGNMDIEINILGDDEDEQ